MKHLSHIPLILLMLWTSAVSYATDSDVYGCHKIENNANKTVIDAGLTAQLLDNIDDDTRTKIQLAALVAAGPEIGISLVEAVSATRLLRTRHATKPYAVSSANDVRLALAQKDLEGFADAWDFVRTNPKGADAWEALVEFPSLRKNVNALKYLANPRTNKILLDVEEALGGHSIARHGHQFPLTELEQRVLNTHPTLPQSRSALKFDSEAIHNDAVNQAFNYFKSEIKAHFDAGGGYRTWESYDYGNRIGEGYHNYNTLSNPTATYVTSTKIKLAFRPDNIHPDGYMLDSSYPFFEP